MEQGGEIKMTLKDWRKTYETSSVIYYEKKNKQVVIENTFQLYQSKFQKVWRIDLLGSNHNFIKRLKITKTKSKALAYARSYMRKH